MPYTIGIQVDSAVPILNHKGECSVQAGLESLKRLHSNYDIFSTELYLCAHIHSIVHTTHGVLCKPHKE